MKIYAEDEAHPPECYQYVIRWKSIATQQNGSSTYYAKGKAAADKVWRLFERRNTDKQVLSVCPD